MHPPGLSVALLFLLSLSASTQTANRFQPFSAAPAWSSWTSSSRTGTASPPPIWKPAPSASRRGKVPYPIRNFDQHKDTDRLSRHTFSVPVAVTNEVAAPPLTPRTDHPSRGRRSLTPSGRARRPGRSPRHARSLLRGPRAQSRRIPRHRTAPADDPRLAPGNAGKTPLALP